MIPVHEAQALIAKHLRLFPAETCPISEASGRILRENIHADRDLPPFDRVMMDGIAIAYAAWEDGRRRFLIEDTAQPGEPPRALVDAAAGSVQVMTGAVLPRGCNCIIPYEDLTIKADEASVRKGTKPVCMQHVHEQAFDRKQGELLLERGCRLLSPQIAIAAAVGKESLMVGYQPSVAVVSNGNELVDLDEEVEPFQVRPINNYGLLAALRRQGFPRVDVFHTRDDKRNMTDCFRKVLKDYDVIIMSGGVSLGKYDYVPTVLDELGVEVVFHKVYQRPGKPMWFGLSDDKKPVFALPGNPVSTLVCFHRYVLPRLEIAMGAPETKPAFAQITQDVVFELPLTFFPPVRISRRPTGLLTATPVPYNNSGDFASLGASDGFIELDAGETEFPSGSVVHFYPWRC